MYLGELYGKKDYDDFYQYLLKAYQHAKLMCERCEPLWYLSQEYKRRFQKELSYQYLLKCVKVPSPPNLIGCCLEYNLYAVDRWNELKKDSLERNDLETFYKIEQLRNESMPKYSNAIITHDWGDPSISD